MQDSPLEECEQEYQRAQDRHSNTSFLDAFEIGLLELIEDITY